MPKTILLGNTSVLESKRDDDDNVVRTPKPELGNQITTVSLPEDPPMRPTDVLRAVRDLWPYHSDVDGPEWVECDDKALAALVASEFTTPDHACRVGRPKGWKEG